MRTTYSKSSLSSSDFKSSKSVSTFVVEDTKYELSDIKEIFGEDIASFVEGASEPDKSLSWEERKQHTINTLKTLDIRHKAVVCADKISNLEDLRILFEIKGNYDFSAFFILDGSNIKINS